MKIPPLDVSLMLQAKGVVVPYTAYQQRQTLLSLSYGIFGTQLVCVMETQTWHSSRGDLGLLEHNGCIVVSVISHCVILIVQTARGW